MVEEITSSGSPDEWSDLPPSPRNFATSRRALSVVLATSIVVPLVCFSAYCYRDYVSRVSAANGAVTRLARVAQEHALKVMDLNGDMSTRVTDVLGARDDRQIDEKEESLHEQLDRIGGGYPQVASIAVFGTGGRLLVSSRYYPSPPISIAGREDFKAARALSPQPYIALPMRGAVSGLPVFNMTTARLTPDGRFLGAIAVALRLDYFERFYGELSEEGLPVAVGLYRRDGATLVRYFGRPAPGKARLSQQRPEPVLAEVLRDKPASGMTRIVSGDDDLATITAFRRVGDYPLYVAVGYEPATVWMQWWKHCALIGILIGVPSIAVWLLVLYSFRQVSAEERAWRSWHAEAMRRASAEASGRRLQRMGALGNLVGNVAHEFNNLLLAVSTNMAIARSKECKDVDAEVGAVERVVEGASALARGLLSVTGKLPARQAIVRLDSWLPSVEEAIRRVFETDTVKVSVEVPSDPWPVLVDVSELKLTIINVATNAGDAMPHGGRFVVQVQNLQMAGDDPDLPAGDYVLVELSDNGEGMPDEVVRRAFEPLFTTRRRVARVGLGLSQVLAACERNGGTARLNSEWGAGTTVRLYLPRYRDAVDDPVLAATASVEATSASRPSVLIVEDNLEVAAGLAAALGFLDLQVHHETGADSALSLLDSGVSFDFVLSDIQMPGRLNGIDLAERLRAQYPTLRMALMTGYADELERAQRVGVPILSKPFAIRDLHHLIVAGLSEDSRHVIRIS
ncbi:ATP-binding protein (plasmid) [Paraburkholderia sp. D15]|uniref:ATP-binding protein n=1 Tax=Paraburkholderia sp. D15 TaxID=2880218 RepID=UPI002478B954|nr:ATP-binding protein [Paraburkholderia sp. D15]WGS55166.1 ATP-binding protein [Paraburkholderia sp. D15]